nr:phosphate signaling complex protein PhoU [Eubacterium sp.]
MTRNRFDRQLLLLNNELVEMGSLICKAIDMAVDSLMNHDVAEAKSTIEFDLEIDHKERDIESICMKLLLQQQPVARDLRLISSALKMITDMERIGDQAADISEINISMAKIPYEIRFDVIPELAEITTDMVEKSIEAFVNKDEELAIQVIGMDDEVDRRFETLKAEVIKAINENADYGEMATDIFMIGKYFERIGDHATNIAEWVVYSIRGEHV